jgi:hypothetical protein
VIRDEFGDASAIPGGTEHDANEGCWLPPCPEPPPGDSFLFSSAQ